MTNEATIIFMRRKTEDKCKGGGIERRQAAKSSTTKVASIPEPSHNREHHHAYQTHNNIKLPLIPRSTAN